MASTTSLGMKAIANMGPTSPYIEAGLDTYIVDNGGSKTVECYIYVRRTNPYAYTTYSPSVDVKITIDGSDTTGTMPITIPGNNNNWLGPVINKASKNFTGAQQTITIAWQTVDHGTYSSGGPYFSGSGSATITVPGSYTAPSGLTRSNTVVNAESVTADVGVTSWGTGGTSAGHYLELSVCSSNNTTNRSYTRLYPGDTTSGTITVDNTASTTSRGITIKPNSRYYLTQYATNGAAGTGNSSFSQAITPPLPPAQFEIVPNSIHETTAQIRWSPDNNSGHYLHDDVIQYSLDNGTTWSTSQPMSDILLTGLTPDTQYTVLGRIIGYSSDPASPTTYSSNATITFTTKKLFKAYGSMNGLTKSISKGYGPVNNQTKEIVAIYGSENGVTKRIY